MTPEQFERQQATLESIKQAVNFIAFVIMLSIIAGMAYAIIAATSSSD